MRSGGGKVVMGCVAVKDGESCSRHCSCASLNCPLPSQENSSPEKVPGSLPWFALPCGLIKVHSCEFTNAQEVVGTRCPPREIARIYHRTEPLSPRMVVHHICRPSCQ